MAWAAGALACWALTVSLTAPAAALTRQQADRIALATLKPQPQAVVYGLPAALGAGRRLSEPFPEHAIRRAAFTLSARPLGQRAWLYWEDLQPGAMFEHPSRLLVIGDRSGRVLSSRPLEWWPMIDAHDAPFVFGPGSGDPRYAVFPAPAASAAAARRSNLAHVADSAAVLPDALKADFAKDCIVAIGFTSTNLPEFKLDFDGLNNFATTYGLPYYQLDPGSDGTALEEFVKDLDKKIPTNAKKPVHCQEVLLYIGGHGIKGSKQVIVGGNLTSDPKHPVETGTERLVKLQDIKNILSYNPKRRFKIKFDACFSGLLVDALKDLLGQYKNLIVAEASSSASESSYFYKPTLTDKSGNTIKSDTNNPGNAAPEKKIGRSEFLNGNLSGWERFLHDAQRVSDAIAAGDPFAHMIADGFSLGQVDDFPAKHGATHPELLINTKAIGMSGYKQGFVVDQPLPGQVVAPPNQGSNKGAPPPTTPPPASLEAFATWAEGVGLTELCVYLAGPPGLDGALDISGPGTSISTPFALDSSGQAVASYGVGGSGTYQVKADAGSSNLSSSITVPQTVAPGEHGPLPSAPFSSAPCQA